MKKMKIKNKIKDKKGNKQTTNKIRINEVDSLTVKMALEPTKLNNVVVGLLSMTLHYSALSLAQLLARYSSPFRFSRDAH